MGGWNSVVGDKSNGNICAPDGLGNRKKKVKCLLTFVEELDSLSLIRDLRNLREGCISGKLQAINIDISWIIYL
jgi:hypothetical protein